MADANLTFNVKKCLACGEVKPVDQFHKNKGCVDGRLNKCKSCRKVSDRAYVEAHAEDARRRAKQWRADHKDAADKRSREWALKNPDRIKANAVKFRRSEKGRASALRGVATRDPLQRKLTARKFYLKNMDRYKQYRRNRRARVRGAQGSHTKEDVEQIALKQRMKCAYCFCKLPEKYHVDHIMPLALGGSNDKSNLQILCPTCNLSKGAKHPLDFANKKGLLF